MINKRNLPKSLYMIAVLLAAGLWGTTGLFIRRLNQSGLGAMEITELRAAITAAVVLVLVLCMDPKLLRVRLKDSWCFFGTGILSVLFFNYSYFHTIQVSSMAVAATLLYTSPVFVMLMSLWLFGERVTARKLIGLSLAVAGCVLVSGIVTGGTLTGTGLLLGIGAGFGYALYSVFTRFALLRGYHTFTITFYTFLFAAVGGLFIADVGEIGRVCTGTGGTSLCVLLVAYALVTTVAPYLLYTFGLQGMENSKAAVVACVEPVVASLLGLLVFAERPDTLTVIGIVLVLTAVVLLNLSPAKKPDDPT